MKFQFVLPVTNSGNPYRDSKGRFTNGPNLKRVEAVFGFSISKNPPIDKINSFFKQYEGKKNEDVAKDIYEKLGFNKPPTTFRQKDYDEGIPVSRAFRPENGESKEMLKSYRKSLFEGERFLRGGNTYGTGDYFSTGRNEYKHADGIMAYAMVKKDIKSVDYIEAKTRVKKLQSTRKLNSSANQFLGDVGIYSALSGYEAVRVKDRNYLVLLDRTKLSKEVDF